MGSFIFNESTDTWDLTLGFLTPQLLALQTKLKEPLSRAQYREVFSKFTLEQLNKHFETLDSNILHDTVGPIFVSELHNAIAQFNIDEE